MARPEFPRPGFVALSKFIRLGSLLRPVLAEEDPDVLEILFLLLLLLDLLFFLLLLLRLLLRRCFLLVFLLLERLRPLIPLLPSILFLPASEFRLLNLLALEAEVDDASVLAWQ